MAKIIRGTSPGTAGKTEGKAKIAESANESLKLSQLKDNYDLALSEYGKIHKRLILLNGVDNSKLWQVIGAKFPSYQILPDTNWISYIKSNLVASIYCVGKSASILPTSEDDRETVENVNVALDHIWETADIGYKQMQAGSNAALYNIGITQVGWDVNNMTGTLGAGPYAKGNVVIKNIDPLHYMRDPFAESLDSASFVITWEDYHKSVIMADPRYKDAFASFLTMRKSGEAMAAPEYINNRADTKKSRDYYTVYTHFVKYIDGTDVKVAEIHTVENEVILCMKDDIKPSCFPFVELFCNLPEGDPVGTSEPAKVLSNNIAYNMLSSMMMTSEYKNQRPPKFISSQSGLNIKTFSKHGNDADHTFVVNGDASRAVHYHQFPQMTAQAMNLQSALIRDVQTTSGVDGRYTGRDTGSVITTGGVEDMLGRVTLIDSPKIANYESYAKSLTKLILANFVEFSIKRKYFKKNPTTGAYEAVEVNFDKLSDAALYHYAINISSEMPKNKQRVASMANMLMEKQMQYGASGNVPELITPQEWLSMQDLPNKEAMLKRMNIQSIQDAAADIAGTLFGFSNLVQTGTNPDDAIAMLAQNKTASNAGEMPPNIIPDIPAEALEPEYPEEEMILDNNNQIM